MAAVFGAKKEIPRSIDELKESTMISKMFRIALTTVLASFALSSAAWATCSNASVRGINGSLGEGTNPEGQPEANLFQFKLDPSTGKFTERMKPSFCAWNVRSRF